MFVFLHFSHVQALDAVQQLEFSQLVLSSACHIYDERFQPIALGEYSALSPHSPIPPNMPNAPDGPVACSLQHCLWSIAWPVA